MESSRTRARRARTELLRLLGVEDDLSNWREGKVQVCHSCVCHSANGYCENPLHISIGTTSENQFDTPEEVRQRRAGKGGRVGGKVTGAQQRDNKTGLFDPEVQQRRVEALQKPVELTRLADGEVRSFPSLTHAADAIQGDRGALGKVCRGVRQAHKGYTARFVD